MRAKSIGEVLCDLKKAEKNFPKKHDIASIYLVRLKAIETALEFDSKEQHNAEVCSKLARFAFLKQAEKRLGKFKFDNDDELVFNNNFLAYDKISEHGSNIVINLCADAVETDLRHDMENRKLIHAYNVAYGNPMGNAFDFGREVK